MKSFSGKLMTRGSHGSLIARHPLVSYFILAYAIAWLLWLPLVLSKGGGVGLLPFATDSNTYGGVTSSIIVIGALGPAIAAVIMSAVTEGRAGVGLLFRRIVRIRVGFQWYVVVLLFPLLPVTLLSLIAVLSASNQYSHMLSSQWGFALFVYVVSAFEGMVLGSPIGEEPGWRGFALPRLQKQMGPLKGTLLLGTLWGLWHAPLVFFTVWGRSYQLMGVVPGFSLFILSTISLSVAMTWVFNQTRGSIFLAILFHSAIDSVVVIGPILFPQSSGNPNAVSGPILLAASALNVAMWVVIAGIVLVATRGRLSYRSSIEQELHPQPISPVAPQAE